MTLETKPKQSSWTYKCLYCHKKFITVMGKIRHVQTKHGEPCRCHIVHADNDVTILEQDQITGEYTIAS